VGCALLHLPVLLAASPGATGDQVRERQHAAASEPATSSAHAAKSDPAVFVPPDGWRPKKRGKFIVYCRRQSKIGTRLTEEVCYDEDGIRAMLLQAREDQERVDQMRRVCSTKTVCASQ
jgi:hypothetical protein